MTNNPTTGWTDWSSTPQQNQSQKLETRIAELEKRFRTHQGIDFASSGADYPHPSQRVRILYFAEGLARLGPEGIQLIQPIDQSSPVISVVGDQFVDDPSSVTPNFIITSNVNPNAIPSTWSALMNTVQGPFGIDAEFGLDTTLGLRAGNFGSFLFLAGSVDSGWYVSGGPISMYSDTSDPSASDGMLWYRTDTDRFRVRMNGVSYNLATTADVPATMNKQPFAAKTTTYTTTNADGVISVDATSASFTVTLVSAVSNAGLTQTFKKINAANVVTLDFNGSQTGDGVLSYALSAQWSWVTFVSDGANWLITGAG